MCVCGGGNRNKIAALTYILSSRQFSSTDAPASLPSWAVIWEHNTPLHGRQPGRLCVCVWATHAGGVCICLCASLQVHVGGSAPLSVLKAAPCLFSRGVSVRA